jgi:hypothetical protein
MKKIDESKLWREIQKILPELPYVIETPLSFIEQALWPLADSNELKFKGKILGHVLRLHGVTITKRNGVRYAVFPKSILSTRQEIKERKMKKVLPKKVLVESVWPW